MPRHNRGLGEAEDGISDDEEEQEESLTQTPKQRSEQTHWMREVIRARDMEILKVLAKIKNQGSDCIDFLSLSYTSNKGQIIEARQALDALGLSSAKIMAKVESKKALSNFESILNCAKMYQCLPQYQA